MTVRKILIIATNVATLGPGGPANGTFLPEIAHAAHEFVSNGMEIVIASPDGGSLPLYGEDPADHVSVAMMNDPVFAAAVADTRRLSDVDPAAFDAVFFPGGYGLLWDLVGNSDVQSIVADFVARNAIISAVCHGPAALLGVTIAGERYLRGRHVTAFAREEEVDYNTIDHIPFVLEERLMLDGARYTKAPIWSEHVIIDGTLITGQNPGSAAAVGRAVAMMVRGRMVAD